MKKILILIPLILQACIALPAGNETREFLNVKNESTNQKISGIRIQYKNKYIMSPDGPRVVNGRAEYKYYLVNESGDRELLAFLGSNFRYNRYYWSFFPLKDQSNWLAFGKTTVDPIVLGLKPSDLIKDFKVILFNKDKILHSMKLKAELLPGSKKDFFKIKNNKLLYMYSNKTFEIVVDGDSFRTFELVK